MPEFAAIVCIFRQLHGADLTGPPVAMLSYRGLVVQIVAGMKWDDEATCWRSMRLSSMPTASMRYIVVDVGSGSFRRHYKPTASRKCH